MNLGDTDSIDKDYPLLEDICHYIGADYADEQDRSLALDLIISSFAELKAKTGMDWYGKRMEYTELYSIALQTVRRMVYLSYYADRDDVKNAEFLKRNIASKIFLLKWTPEAVRARGDG